MNAAAITVIIIIGTIAVIEAVSIFVRIPCAECSRGFTAVVVLNGTDNVNLKIESILHKLRWSDGELIQKIILIDNGLNCVQARLCRNYCMENSFLELIKPDEAINLIISNEKMM